MELTSLNLRRWFLMVFALSCLGLNIVAYILYAKNESIQNSRSWVTHTYEVIATEYDLFSNLEDMETAQRGYLLTGELSFLEPYRQAQTHVDTMFAKLKFLTSDNPHQQIRLDHYKPVIDRHHALLEQQIQQKKTWGSVSTAEIASNKAIIDQLRGLHAGVIDEESRLLALRSADVDNRQHNYVMTIFLSAALSVIGLLLANGVILFLTIRRQAAEADLIRMNKEMEGFTYIASHDLRSPLVNLKGFSSEMRHGIEEIRPVIERLAASASEEDRKTIARVFDEDISDALRYIHASVEKMDKLTNAILELSRIGRRSLKFEPVNADKVVRHILDTLHHQIAAKGIEVSIHSLPTVVADYLSLEQVFGNVIDNAIKYLDPQRAGRLEIGGHRNYRETTFWVKDNGRGINPGDMQKIFEIYRRGGNNEMIPGEGMGMAYVRATVRRMSGSIWAESTQGVGTTFYFTISNTLKKEDDNG